MGLITVNANPRNQSSLLHSVRNVLDLAEHGSSMKRVKGVIAPKPLSEIQPQWVLRDGAARAHFCLIYFNGTIKIAEY
ncbi:hypothetical protein GDO78_018098 [Eleutherodactylus coqui]|uniref:Uncharacterized protein n=1 Tax=Eleutherodactylus coqui TaxID=57060 RepID=A0A8J6BQF9_ELECQ|nr:hypothetical protein GDO78_018098 [Eleutherodactylus coqui]